MERKNGCKNEAAKNADNIVLNNAHVCAFSKYFFLLFWKKIGEKEDNCYHIRKKCL